MRTDFSTPTAFRRFTHALHSDALEGSAHMALAVLSALTLVTVVAGVELFRLHQMAVTTAHLEARNANAERAIAALELRAGAVLARRRQLRAALAVRRSSARRALEVARIGNALPNEVTLTAMRQQGDRWQVEGRAQTLHGIGRTFERLRRIVDIAPGRTFDVHRDETRAGAIGFSIELERDARSL